jgi:hypothetical protein
MHGGCSRVLNTDDCELLHLRSMREDSERPSAFDTPQNARATCLHPLTCWTPGYRRSKAGVALVADVGVQQVVLR